MKKATEIQAGGTNVSPGDFGEHIFWEDSLFLSSVGGPPPAVFPAPKSVSSKMLSWSQPAKALREVEAFGVIAKKKNRCPTGIGGAT